MVGKMLIESVQIDDPSETDANYLARKKAKPADPNVGKVWVARNRVTQLGGLAYIRKREPHHEWVAERFLNLYEARYGRITPAIDVGRVRVDTSIIGHDGGMASALDATRAIQDAERMLDSDDFKMCVAVICFGVSIVDMTGNRGRRLDRDVRRFLGVLDRLAVLWGRMQGPKEYALNA